MSEYKEGETALSSLYKDKCKDLEETILSMDEEATELANKIIELEAENKRLRAALEKAKLECEKSYDIGDLMYSDLYEYICEALEESKDE